MNKHDNSWKDAFCSNLPMDDFQTDGACEVNSHSTLIIFLLGRCSFMSHSLSYLTFNQECDLNPQDFFTQKQFFDSFSNVSKSCFFRL